MIKQFIADEDGAALVEYVLLVTMIAAVCIIALRFLGGVLSNRLNVTANYISKSQ